ncbi:MAG: hypothetical protein QXS93_03235 [Candidatus Micrarchaeia archaeon]
MPEAYKQTPEYKKAFEQFKIAKPEELYKVYEGALAKTPAQKREIINAAFSHYISTPEGKSKIEAAMKAQERREEVAKQMGAKVNGIIDTAFSMKARFVKANTELAQTMDSTYLKKVDERNKCLPLFDESQKFVSDASKTFKEITQQFKDGKLNENEYVAKCAALTAALQFEITRLNVAVRASLDESKDSKEYLNKVAGTFKDARDKLFKTASSGASAEQVIASIKDANSYVAKNFLKDTDFISMVRMWHGVDQAEVAKATNLWFAAEKSLKKIADGEEITYNDAKNISAFIALNMEGIRARETRETRAINAGVMVLSIFAVGTLTPVVSEYVGSHAIGGMLTGGVSEAGAQLGLDAVFGRVGTAGKYVTLLGIGALFGGAIGASEAYAATLGAGKAFAKNIRKLPKYLEEIEKAYKGSHLIHHNETSVDDAFGE